MSITERINPVTPLVHDVIHRRNRRSPRSSPSNPQHASGSVDFMKPLRCKVCGYPLTPGPLGGLWCCVYGSHNGRTVS